MTEKISGFIRFKIKNLYIYIYIYRDIYIYNRLIFSGYIRFKVYKIGSHKPI